MDIKDFYNSLSEQVDNAERPYVDSLFMDEISKKQFILWAFGNENAPIIRWIHLWNENHNDIFFIDAEDLDLDIDFRAELRKMIEAWSGQKAINSEMAQGEN